MAVGVIAFGSLLAKAGPEIDAATAEVVPGLVTPFPVEFARSSMKRDGAPTLVPCDAGAPVNCSVIVLEERISLDEGRNLLYRRERNRIGSGETCTPRWRNWIPEVRCFGPTEVSIYTALPEGIEPLTAKNLADLAIASAYADSGEEKRDGITYLADALDHGIITPLSEGYEQEILGRLRVSTLREAWDAVVRGEGR